MNVLETLNNHYGTSWDGHAMLPKKWPSSIKTGPYDLTLVIRMTSSRDIHGYNDPIEEANYRTLRDLWEESPALTDGGYRDFYSIGLLWDEKAPEDLIDVIEALDNHPVLDEDLECAIRSQWIDYDWANNGLYDSQSFLAKLLGVDADALDFEELERALCRDIRWSEDHPAWYEYGGGAVFQYETVILANLEKYRAMV